MNEVNMKLVKETRNVVKWNEKEELWWLEKNDMLSRFVEVLVKIFKETLRPDKKRIFNITLLIRQNFLSLCETPELMTFLFGQPLIWWWDEEIEDYRWASRLENEVIERVTNELGLEDAEYDEVFKD